MKTVLRKGQTKQLRTYGDLLPIMQFPTISGRSSKIDQADKDFTDKMMKVGKLLNITVADHQIITETDFYSFANTGLMKELAKSGLYEVTQKESEEMKAWREDMLKKRAKEEERRIIAENLLKAGLSVDKVCKHTRLRCNSVEKMRREMESKKGVFPVI